MRTSVLFASAASAAASGCGQGVPWGLSPNAQTYQTLNMADSDPRLGPIQREYMIRLPRGYTGNKKVPVFMYFHGWGANMYQDDWQTVANQYGAIIVNPNGMGEGTGMPSWNCGQAGRSDTCRNPQDATQYPSCRAVGKRGPCNCYTCYDDVHFVAKLAAHLESQLCVDTDSYFAAGGSNGGIFLYYLVPQLAERGFNLKFNAVAPWYGANFVNMDDVPAKAAGTSFFHFHGLQDTEVPPDGGRSVDGYLYTPVGTTLHEYASINGCAAQATHVNDGFGGMTHNCLEHTGCSTKSRIVRCNYPGQEHAFWPANAEAITFSFFFGNSALDNSTVIV